MLAARDLQSILDILKGMTGVELALAKVYGRCAEVWKADEAFWLGLERAEMTHAEHIRTMAEIIQRTPDRFQLNRPFNSVAIKTFLSGVEQNSDRLEKQQITREGMLILARDMETSILEKNYHEIVKTDDLGYLTLVRGIVSDTVRHKNTLVDKIREGTA